MQSRDVIEDQPRKGPCPTMKFPEFTVISELWVLRREHSTAVACDTTGAVGSMLILCSLDDTSRSFAQGDMKRIQLECR